MQPKQLIDNSIKPLAALLKERGFRKIGRRFHKDVGEAREFLCVQASQWNHQGHHTSFTIELGLFLPQVLEMLGRDVPEKPSSITGFTWRERLGQLTPVRGDHWWEIDNESSVNKVSKNVLEMVEEYGLPWLDSGITYDGFHNILSSSIGIQPAELLWSLGHRIEARRCIEKVPSLEEPGYEVLREWLETHPL